MAFRQTSVIFFLAALLLSSCTKTVKAPEPSAGLDTVPFYRKGSAAFDTQTAVKAFEAKKEAAGTNQEKFGEEIKKRIEQKGVKVQIPDPWIPPKVRTTADLPPPMRGFPKDKYGYPDWTATVEGGFIRPKSSLPGEPAVEEQILDMDVVFEINDKLMANVLFPHKIHTYWLSCKICHPAIFKPKRGANIFTMYDVWNGQYCGRCHGKVSYQPKGFENCRRCHRAPKRTMGVK
ncbi:MAG: hypothetical protein HY890_00640 [Deltaproteobacteria bacterium]|nr:hypothetical protein [Deltaproteobacteria bacterium]